MKTRILFFTSDFCRYCNDAEVILRKVLTGREDVELHILNVKYPENVKLAQKYLEMIGITFSSVIIPLIVINEKNIIAGIGPDFEEQLRKILSKNEWKK